MLYKLTPQKAIGLVNANSNICTDDNSLNEILHILKNCNISYEIKLIDIHPNNYHEIRII